MIPGSSYSSLTQLPRHSHCGFISPAVFFSDLEFKRTTNLGVAAAGNKAGRLDPVCSATGLRGTAYLSLLGPGRRTFPFGFCGPQRPVRPGNSGSRRGQASSGPSKERGQPSSIRVLKMFLRKPIQMSSALQGSTDIIIIKQRLHADFIFKALWGWLGRGGSGVAQRIPSWEVTPSTPPTTSLGLVPPASQPEFTVVIACRVNKGPFMQLFPILLAFIPLGLFQGESTLGAPHSAWKRGSEGLVRGKVAGT